VGKNTQPKIGKNKGRSSCEVLRFLYSATYTDGDQHSDRDVNSRTMRANHAEIDHLYSMHHHPSQQNHLFCYCPFYSAFTDSRQQFARRL
jgi:hypothetical protein